MRYDLAIIGSGPGGYVAAIRGAQLGMKTVLIERYDTLGGTCLNVGCIPSKALLDSSEHFYQAKEDFAQHGIEISEMRINMNQMIDRKDEVVKQTCDGVAFLMKKNKVDVVYGHGRFKDAHHIVIEKKDGKSETIEADKIIIATGSKPAMPDGFDYDKKRVFTSTEALELREVPGSLLVVGGGAIGLEMGSVFSRLGTKVKVVEFMDRLVPAMDKDVSKELYRSLKKQGIEFYLKHKVTEVKANEKSATVSFEPRDGGEAIKDRYDYVLISIGRRPYTHDLGLDNVNVSLDEKGFVQVDEQLRTTEKNIYAIGDVIGGAMLAHKASDEGVFVVESMAGQKPRIDYHLIPSVVYTWPEAAGVGYTEEQVKSQGKEYKVGKFPFSASGKASASGEKDGFVKVIFDAKYGEWLGCHMIGAGVTDMIAEAVLGRKLETTGHEVLKTIHPHPTMSEAVMEAVADAYGEVIHL